MTKIMLPQSNTQQVKDLCALAPVIPVLAFNSPEEAVATAKALVSGGLPVLEVTLRTEAALASIEAIAKEVPEARVGAGTIASPEDFDNAVNAGSEFIVSPGVTKELLEHGAQSSTPFLPGIQSVSQVMEGMAMGYQCFKLFPAEVLGGQAMLKAINGPFPNVMFCPTGGIRVNTAPEYLALPNVMCVGGTWLTPADLISSQDWSAIEDLAKAASGLAV